MNENNYIATILAPNSGEDKLEVGNTQFEVWS